MSFTNYQNCMYGKTYIMCDLIYDASFFTDDLLKSFEFSRDYGKEAFANR